MALYKNIMNINVIFIYTQQHKHMYTGQIYYKGEPITVQQAVDLNLIDVDANGNIWLKNDVSHLIKITGDLNLG